MTVSELVRAGEEFEGRDNVAHEWVTVPREEMLRRITQAQAYGLDVVRKQGTSREYIEIGRDGCAYGHYFVKETV